MVSGISFTENIADLAGTTGVQTNILNFNLTKTAELFFTPGGRGF